MENYSEMVDEVLRGLDWGLIMNFYESGTYIETRKKKKNKDLSIKVTKESIKKELKDLIRFVVDSNAKELHHDQWIIFWRSGEDERNRLGSRLEVAFVPTRFVSFENDTVADDHAIEPDLDEMEKETLKDLLTKSIKEENYELSAVIHSRLKKLSKGKTS